MTRRSRLASVTESGPTRVGPCGSIGQRTKRWTRAAIWSGKMDALTRRGLVNAVVTCSGTTIP
jgi:hypothetical protein